jgi:hypothetical protein
MTLYRLGLSRNSAGTILMEYIGDYSKSMLDRSEWKISIIPYLAMSRLFNKWGTRTEDVLTALVNSSYLQAVQINDIDFMYTFYNKCSELPQAFEITPREVLPPTVVKILVNHEVN